MQDNHLVRRHCRLSPELLASRTGAGGSHCDDLRARDRRAPAQKAPWVYEGLREDNAATGRGSGSSTRRAVVGSGRSAFSAFRSSRRIASGREGFKARGRLAIQAFNSRRSSGRRRTPTRVPGSVLGRPIFFVIWVDTSSAGPPMRSTATVAMKSTARAWTGGRTQRLWSVSQNHSLIMTKSG
jgi:hypothetical protein